MRLVISHVQATVTGMHGAHGTTVRCPPDVKARVEFTSVEPAPPTGTVWRPTVCWSRDRAQGLSRVANRWAIGRSKCRIARWGIGRSKVVWQRSMRGIDRSKVGMARWGIGRSKGGMARWGTGRSEVVWQGEILAGQRWYGKVRYWQVKGGMARWGIGRSKVWYGKGEVLADQRWYGKVRYWQVKGGMARWDIGRSKVVWQGEVLAGQRWHGKVRYWQVRGGTARSRWGIGRSEVD